MPGDALQFFCPEHQSLSREVVPPTQPACLHSAPHSLGTGFPGEARWCWCTECEAFFPLEFENRGLPRLCPRCGAIFGEAVLGSACGVFVLVPSGKSHPLPAFLARGFPPERPLAGLGPLDGAEPAWVSHRCRLCGEIALRTSRTACPFCKEPTATRPGLLPGLPMTVLMARKRFLRAEWVDPPDGTGLFRRSLNTGPFRVIAHDGGWWMVPDAFEDALENAPAADYLHGTWAAAFSTRGVLRDADVIVHRPAWVNREADGKYRLLEKGDLVFERNPPAPPPGLPDTLRQVLKRFPRVDWVIPHGEEGFFKRTRNTGPLRVIQHGGGWWMVPDALDTSLDNARAAANLGRYWACAFETRGEPPGSAVKVCRAARVRVESDGLYRLLERGEIAFERKPKHPPPPQPPPPPPPWPWGRIVLCTLGILIVTVAAFLIFQNKFWARGGVETVPTPPPTPPVQDPSAESRKKASDALATARREFTAERYEQASKACAAGLEIDPTHEDLKDLRNKADRAAACLKTAEQALVERDFPEVARRAEALLGLNPGSLQAKALLAYVKATGLVRKAQASFEDSRLEEALRTCDEALALDPSNAEAAELRRRIQRTIEILDSP